MGGAAVPSCTQVTESGSVCVVKGTADFSGASGSIELYASYDSLTIAYPTSCSCTATLQNPALDLYEGSYHVAFDCGQRNSTCNCASPAFSSNSSCGGVLTSDAGALTFAGPPSTQIQYCVKGNTLQLHDVSCGFPFLGTGYLTLAKQ
jgi:hypothetical protein